jgi:carbonic anhydrase
MIPYVQQVQHVQRLLISSVLLLPLLGATVGCGSSEASQWGYEGEQGPAHWAAMAEAYAVCDTGLFQSPVDILTEHVDVVELEPLVFDYGQTPLQIVNNGYTIQVNVSGESTLTLGERHFSVAQFHFHGPSEHLVDGLHAAMELHLVHRDEAGLPGVVGVLIQPGAANAELAKAWAHMPAQVGKVADVSTVQISLPGLLPKDRAAYRYLGSLTTPPCTEGVSWFVLAEPIEASPEQIDAFSAVIPPNARPTQLLHGRVVRRADTR